MKKDEDVVYVQDDRIRIPKELLELSLDELKRRIERMEAEHREARRTA